jgi:hypothetical protein
MMIINDKKLNVEEIDNNFNNNNKCEHDNNKSYALLENGIYLCKTI